MNVDLRHWKLYEGTKLPDDFEENPSLGFVYLIRRKSDGKFYIRQKKILKVEKKPPLKGKVRKRRVIKQTDWKKYSGSSNVLKEEIAQLGEDAFTFEILEFCDSKWMMNYEELRLQMLNNVLLRTDSYNRIVNVRLAKFDSIIEKCNERGNHQITQPF